MNDLHHAAIRGYADRTRAVLSRGAIDIDQGDPEGVTALMFASLEGYPSVVKLLVDKGADVSLAADDTFTALLASAEQGHVDVVKVLLEAGADLRAVDSLGGNALHLASCRGHLEVMGLVIEAGVNPDSRRFDGSTPLMAAAYQGHMGAVNVLLRAKADPLLTDMTRDSAVALDLAAQRGHSHVVSELVRQLGIHGCGGPTGGVRALMLASQNHHVEAMAALMSAGVVDTGWALSAAAGHARKVPVGILLQCYKGTAEGKRAYVNTRDHLGTPPVLYAIGCAGVSSARIVQLLVSAGAATSSTTRVRNYTGFIFYDTPLTFTTRLLREKKIVRGKDFTQDQLRALEAIRRLLLRVKAVHAVSWLWARDVPCVARVASEGANKGRTTPNPLTSMLPILRRRARRRPGTILASLFR